MVDKKTDLSQANYVIGILSVVFAFVSPIAGLILGIIGMNMSKKHDNELSKNARKLNKLGIIISAIILVLSIIAGVYLTLNPLALK